MNWGMIGALGGMGNGTGLGGALMAQGAHLAEIEKEDRLDTKQRSYQQWLMAAQDEYSVKREGRQYTRDIETEGRADQRTIASEGRQVTREVDREGRAVKQAIEADERNWTNEKARAPEKRGIKVADKTAELEGALTFETTNLPAITKNTAAKAEAAQTSSDKNLKNATAERYRKISVDPDDKTSGDAIKAQIRGVQADRQRVQALIDAQMAKAGEPTTDGTPSVPAWNPETNPNQKALLKRVQDLDDQERQLRLAALPKNPDTSPPVRKGEAAATAPAPAKGAQPAAAPAAEAPWHKGLPDDLKAERAGGEGTSPTRAEALRATESQIEGQLAELEGNGPGGLATASYEKRAAHQRTVDALKKNLSVTRAARKRAEEAEVPDSVRRPAFGVARP